MNKLFFLVLLICCATITHAQKLTAEQVGIKKTFVDFLAFYKKNHKKFESFKLYSGTGKEQGPPYHINWKTGVQQYFNYLRKSVPYVGGAYIIAETKHFKDAEKSFRQYPEDEIPAEFDFDRWSGGQETVEYNIQWYTSSKNKYEGKITGDKAVLRIGTPEGGSNTKTWYFVPFAKENGQWKMADNIYPE